MGAEPGHVLMVELITRETVQCTPAQAIDELMDMRKAERWYVNRLKRIREHLSGCQFKGMPLLDVPMSMSSIDAVLKEAWAIVNSPAYRQREYEQTLQAYARPVH